MGGVACAAVSCNGWGISRNVGRKDEVGALACVGKTSTHESANDAKIETFKHRIAFSPPDKVSSFLAD
jgi:hypothetical protein